MRGPSVKKTARARSLRRGSTHVELLLWRRLRDRQFCGCKFVRQEPIGPYYGDFICRERRLIVEVDGGQHAENPSDVRRDAFLTALGYRVVRIWNNDVLNNLDGVLDFLASDLEKAPHPVPLPASGERVRNGNIG